MPTYCYKTDGGEVFEYVFQVGKAPARIGTPSGPAKRDFGLERKGVPPTRGWPMECVASGVNAAQAAELSKYLAKAGVPTEVTPDGNPVYRDAKHRRKALAARGMFDRSAYC